MTSGSQLPSGQIGAVPDVTIRSPTTTTRLQPTDASYGEAIGRAHGRVFGDIRPASTQVVVAALLRPEWKVEIEAEAVIA